MRVRDLCYINRKNLNTDIEFDSYLYLGTGNITENLIDNVQIFKNRAELPSRAKRMVSPGDIIISTVRPIQKHYGILEKPEDNLLVSTGFAVLTPKKEIVNGHYLYYYLTQKKITNYFQMIAESSVSSYPSITPDIIGNVEIELPPIDEQNRIANIIKNVDVKISINLELISFLEEYSKLLFYKWFVDFNFPNEEGKPYKDNGGEMFEVDGKMIPVGWTREKIGKWKKAELIKSGILEFEGEKRYITTSDVIGIDINLGADKVNYGDRTSRANMQPELNSVWFAKMQNSPKHIFITEENFVESYILSTGFAGLRCDEISFPYIATFVNSRQFEEMKNLRCNGSTQKAINDEGIKTIKVVIPNEEVLSSFSKITYPIYKKINLLQQENQLLEETRDLLIKKLIK